MKTLKEKAKEYANSIAQSEERRKYCVEDFMAGAECMKEHMIKWLNNHVASYVSIENDEEEPGIVCVCNKKELIDDLKKHLDLLMKEKVKNNIKNE